jgi:hypothetical protein
MEAMYYNKVRSINVKPSSSERYTGHGIGHSTQMSEVYSLGQQLYFQKPSISIELLCKGKAFLTTSVATIEQCL